MGWVKGQPSPNPRGRPPAGQSLAERIRRAVDKHQIVARLVKMATTDGDPNQFAAVRLMLEYSLGKPVALQQDISVGTQEIRVVYVDAPPEHMQPTTDLMLPISEYKALE